MFLTYPGSEYNEEPHGPRQNPEHPETKPPNQDGPKYDPQEDDQGDNRLQLGPTRLPWISTQGSPGERPPPGSVEAPGQRQLQQMPRARPEEWPRQQPGCTREPCGIQRFSTSQGFFIIMGPALAGIEASNNLEPGNGNILLRHPTSHIGPARTEMLFFNMGTREEIHPSDDGPHQASARRLSGYCQEGGQEQLQEPRAGEDRPSCQVAGPVHITEVAYFNLLPPPSLIFTPPMCGSYLISTRDLNREEAFGSQHRRLPTRQQ